MSTSLPELKQTVFLVDDDPSVRSALGNLIESAGLSVQLFSSAEEFLAYWQVPMAGCLVLDVRLPRMSGMELLGRLSALAAIPVIIMTAHGDIPMVKKALKAGATEFLTKPFNDDELLNAILQAFEADWARRQSEAALSSIRARHASLSERERQVFELVTQGKLNKEIADELHLSVVTVKLYRRQLMEKMEADSLADLVRMRERISRNEPPRA
jgi:FixJ family two-component response regulator